MLPAQDFIAHYQPIIQAESGATVGVEVLARLPSLGRWLPPQDALLAAVPDGWLNVDLTALWSALRLDAQARYFCPPHIFVNLSARVLSDPEQLSIYLESVADATVRMQQAALVVEIDEHWQARDEELRAAAALLRQAGAQVAMDDHRGSFDDVSREQALPWEFIKIDSSARHQGCPRLSLSDMVARFQQGEHPRPSVIVECVEDLSDVDCFLAHCPDVWIQGFCFSHPLPLEELLQSCAA